MNKFTKLFLILFFPLLISACGGGGGGGSSSSSTSCTTSTSSFCTSEFNNQYGLVTTKAYEAFDDGYDGDGIKVAILDGEFDLNHSDLDANWITGYDEEDDDNTPGRSGSHSDSHGTHVAGIIGAEKNNSGMMGIAYNASLMPVKIFADNGSAMSDISNSVAYAVDNGATVLNNSWGTSTWTSAATCTTGGVSYTCYGYIPGTSSSGFNGTDERTEWDDVATANAVAVFAAGNNGNNSETGQIDFYASRSTSSAFIEDYSPQVVKDAGLISYTNRSTYEARFGLIDSDVSENWLNVVAVDSNNTIADFSNGCGDTKAYCIAAPGVGIYSTVHTSIDSSGYKKYPGTSMAAPHVSGAVAVMKEKWPNLTGAQIVDLILDSATDLGASGVDEVYGVGLLNMAGAMTATASQKFSYVDSSGNLKKIEKNGSIKANSILGNLVSENASIGFVDSYNRVYSNISNDFNFNKLDNLSEEQKFFKFRNGINSGNLNTSLNMSFVDYGNQGDSFDLKYRTYSFQEDSYQNTLLGDNILSATLINNLTLSMNPIDSNNNNSFLLKKDFASISPKFQNMITFGYGYEQKRLLNSDLSGAFEAKNTNTFYTKVSRKQKISEKSYLNFNVGYGITRANFENKDFFNMSDIETSNASVGYVHAQENSKFALSLEAPLSVHSGQANYYSVSGYNKDGDYTNGLQSINLKPDQKELKLSVYYDKLINENTNYGIAAYQTNSGSNNLQLVLSKTF